jgi:two-component system, chemotaxis family, sensor histidine kinase and response regulator WspE
MWRHSGAIILYIEENHTLLRLVHDVLAFAGWYVNPCGDAGTGYALIESQERFDLLLIDLDLYGYDGLHLARHARKQAHRRQTPLILLALADRAEEARRAGADAFLRKPNNLIDLVDTIRQLLAAPANKDSTPPA